jgi:DNA-binding CsgD family transcriptional regulator
VDPKPLTDRQREVLRFVITSWLERRRAPTSAEIASRFGYTRPAALGHLRALARKRWVRLGADGATAEVVAPEHALRSLAES